MNANLIFLAVFMVNLLGMCGGLGLALHERLARPVDIRHCALLFLLTFIPILLRGQWFEWMAWPPVMLALILVVRFVRNINARTRARRLLGRSVPHT